jgi:hypothetical protein
MRVHGLITAGHYSDDGPGVPVTLINGGPCGETFHVHRVDAGSRPNAATNPTKLHSLRAAPPRGHHLAICVAPLIGGLSTSTPKAGNEGRNPPIDDFINGIDPSRTLGVISRFVRSRLRPLRLTN